MTPDDDGKPHATTLDAARDLLIAYLNDGPRSEDADGWISFVNDYNKDRGERVIYFEVTDPSGICEGFRISLTRDY